MSKRYIAFLVLTVIVGAAVGAGAWLWYQSGRSETFSSNKVLFKYPLGYSQEDASASRNKHSETMVKLVRENPVGVIELNHETGAIIGANLTKTNFLDSLERSAERTLPLTYEKFQKKDLSRIKVSGRDASRFDFTYMGKDKKTTLYATLLIMPSQNDAYYLYAQSSDKNMWQTTANKIQSTIIIHS